uniref:Uncharacterized protein n=1 Tax=Oryza glumipatula TaxID=40148 RepID=A0A0D9ZIA2_9ORYZ
MVVEGIVKLRLLYAARQVEFKLNFARFGGGDFTQFRVGVASPIPNCPASSPRAAPGISSDGFKATTATVQRHDLLEDDMATDYRREARCTRRQRSACGDFVNLKNLPAQSSKMLIGREKRRRRGWQRRAVTGGGGGHGGGDSGELRCGRRPEDWRCMRRILELNQWRRY